MDGPYTGRRVLLAPLPTHLWVAQVAGLGAVYLAVAWVSFQTAVPGAFAVPIWPAAGVAFAAVYAWGYRVWPGVVLGVLGVDLWMGGGAHVALSVAVGSTAAAVAGAWLVKRFESHVKPYWGPRQVTALVLGAGVLATTLSAFTGPLALWAWGQLPGGKLVETMLLFWLGDACGVVIVAPFLLTLGQWPGFTLGAGQRTAFLAYLGVVAAVSAGSAVGWVPAAGLEDLLGYFTLPLMAFGTFRFGPAAAAVTGLLVWGFGIYGAATGHGPLGVSGQPLESMVAYQLGMGMWSATNLVIASLVLDRHRVNGALRESLDNFQRLFNATFEGILVHDGRRILDVNEALLSMLGYAREEVVGRSPLSMVEPHYHERVRRHYQEKAGGLLEGTLHRKDGTPLQVEMAARDLAYEGHQARVVTVRDISRRKQAEERMQRQEEQLRQSQKMEALGRLAGGVAHDFNNLLVGIQGYAELLAGRVGDDPALARPVRAVVRCAERAADLTQHLLSFSRKGDLKREAMDANGVLKGVVGLLQHCLDRRVVVNTRFQASVATIMGDAAQLESMVLNLALNAGDAMPTGGALTLATETVTLPEELAGVVPSALVPGDYLVLTVTDEGQGMDEATRLRCFEPFFTTKPPGRGTGLGLATVYGVVKAHDGGIKVSSEPGVGTTFTVYLPLVSASETQGAAAGQPALTMGAGRVMVVDDEEHIRELAQELLGSLGYDVVTCADGEEAVQRFQNERETVDLVLLDVVMPRLDGWQVLDAIRRMDPTAAVVLCSGYSGTRRTDATVPWLQKPFRLQELADTVAQALQQPPPPGLH